MKYLPCFILIIILSFSFSCKKEETEKGCLDLPTSASFMIGSNTFKVTHDPVWLSNGIYQSIGFRHDLSGGGQELVTIIFEGDTAGVYSLKSVSDPHRASYMGPSSNGNILFTGPQQTGTLTITDIDLTTGCLTGSYQFTANYVQVTGEFQSLRFD